MFVVIGLKKGLV